MRDMTKAVDTVRKHEHRDFLRTGEASPLVGTKYVWLFTDENRPAYHADTFATLQALNLKSRPGVGDQGSLADTMDLPSAGGGETLLHPLKRLGRAIPT